MKRLCMMMSVLIALMLCGCGAEQSAETTGAAKQDRPVTGAVQTVNPFSTFETVEEAAAVTGYSITLPEAAPEWTEEFVARAANDKSMIEIIYTGEENELRIRKGPGDRDISGIYDDYTYEEEILVDQCVVAEKGNGEKVHLAMWYQNDYTYFIRSVQGLTQEEVAELVRVIR